MLTYDLIVPVGESPQTGFYEIGLTIPYANHRHYARTRSANFPDGWSYQWYLEFGDNPMDPEHVYLKSVTGLDIISPKADFEVKIGKDVVLNISWPAGHGEDIKVRLPVPDFRNVLRSTSRLDILFVHVSLKIDFFIPGYAKSSLTGTKFAQQFKTLLESKIGSDVDIVPNNGQEQLAAHWAILAARSEFFNGIYRNDCREKREHTIQLDLSFDACKKLLEFIYTDQVEFSSVENAQALLKAGDVYFIKDLKIAAENYLLSKLNQGNAVDLLVLSNSHKADNLKKEALDCLAKHPSSATVKEKFPSLCNHPELVAELIVRVRRFVPVPVSESSQTFFYEKSFTIHWTNIAKTVRTQSFPDGWSFQWYLEFGSDKPQEKGHTHICVKRVVGLNEISPRAYFKVKIGKDVVLNILWPARHNEEIKVKLPVSDYRALMTTSTDLSYLFIRVTLRIAVRGMSAPSATTSWKATKLAQQFKTLLDSQLGADVAIVPNCGKEQLAAHWSILAARSEFFAGIYRNDCKEKREQTIQLDLNFESCKKLLEFVYTDEVEFSGVEDAQALLKAGDVYFMEDLKIAAENYLRSKLNQNNAVDLLILSYSHKADNLKKEALDCLAKHPKSATLKDNFSALYNYPELVAELIVHVRSD